MRISDWSSDVCSSDLAIAHDVGLSDVEQPAGRRDVIQLLKRAQSNSADGFFGHPRRRLGIAGTARQQEQQEREGCRAHAWHLPFSTGGRRRGASPGRSEEHTSELQSLMRTSYAVFCLTKKNTS